jgi:hypothetical protein
MKYQEIMLFCRNLGLGRYLFWAHQISIIVASNLENPDPPKSEDWFEYSSISAYDRLRCNQKAKSGTVWLPLHNYIAK